ncbi:hypothetical protein EON63_11515, partial [archaeon]
MLGSIYRIITKLAFPPSEILVSSITYFYVGALTICACILIFYRLLRMRVSQIYYHTKDVCDGYGDDVWEGDGHSEGNGSKGYSYGAIPSMDTI